jgi:hypothetical protein
MDSIRPLNAQQGGQKRLFRLACKDTIAELLFTQFLPVQGGMWAF